MAASRHAKQAVMTPEQFQRYLKDNASAIDEPDYEVVGAEGLSPAASAANLSGAAAAAGAAGAAGGAGRRSPSVGEPDTALSQDEAFKRKFDAYRAGLQERYGERDHPPTPSAPTAGTATAATGAAAAAAAGAAYAAAGPAPSVSPVVPHRSLLQPQGEASPQPKHAYPVYASYANLNTTYQIRVDAPPAAAAGAGAAGSAGVSPHPHAHAAVPLSAPPRGRASSRADEKHSPLSAPAPVTPASAPLPYPYGVSASGSGEGQLPPQIEGEGQPQVEGSGSGGGSGSSGSHVEGVKGSATETGLDAFEVQKLLEAKDPDFDAKKRDDREAKRRRIRKRIERWSTTLQRKYPILHWLETRTGVNKVYLVLFACVVLFAMAFFGLGMNHLSDVIGFTYPVFRSYKCLERPNEQRDELRYWLVYWIVFGLFGTVEAASDTLLSWVPFYYPVKLAFLMWCFLPAYRGAQSVYDVVVRPTLAKHESHIDNGLSSVRTMASRSVAEVGNAAARTMRSQSIALSDAMKNKFIESLVRGAAQGKGAGAPDDSPQPLLGPPNDSPQQVASAQAAAAAAGGPAPALPPENRV